MCGILYYQGYQDVSENDFNEAINKLNLRGPDNNNTKTISENKKWDLPVYLLMIYPVMAINHL